MKVITILSTLAALAMAELKAGLKNSLAFSVVEQGKDVYFDTIVQLINNVQIPDIDLSTHKAYMHDNTFWLDQRTEDVEIYADPENNAVVLRCNKMSAGFRTEHFRYKETIFVAKGHAEVDMKTVTIQMGVKFGTQTLEDGRIVPSIDSVDVIVDIDRRDIKIHIFGNIWTDFASLFEVFFKGTVVDLIQTTVSATLNTGIPMVTNKIMDKLDGYFPVPLIPNWEVDWETPEAAQVTSSAFEIGVRGLMFDKEFGEEEPAVAIPDMPYRDDLRMNGYQAYISSYTIDAFASSWLEVGAIKGWFNDTMVPEWAPMDLTTTSLNVLLPGIEAYYGANLPMDIHYDVLALSNFGVQEANAVMTGTTTLRTEFWVELTDGTRAMAADLTLTDTDFSFNADVANMNVTLNIQKINVDKVSVNSCAFGKLSALTLKLELNNGFRLFMPVINGHLSKKPITVPHNIFGIFELHDLTLGYYDDYIYAGATPIFLAPSTEEVLELIQ